MIGFLTRWLVTFVAVLLVSFATGLIQFADWGQAAIFALVLGLLNAFLRPVVNILALPLNILTLGLFSIVINLFVFWLATTIVQVGIAGGLLGLVVAALAVTIISGIINRFV